VEIDVDANLRRNDHHLIAVDDYGGLARVASGRRAELDRLRHESDEPIAEKDCPSACDTEAQSDNCFQPIVLVRHNAPRKACNATIACCLICVGSTVTAVTCATNGRDIARCSRDSGACWPSQKALSCKACDRPHSRIVWSDHPKTHGRPDNHPKGGSHIFGRP
jgi:hypothetical protein